MRGFGTDRIQAHVPSLGRQWRDLLQVKRSADEIGGGAALVAVLAALVLLLGAAVAAGLAYQRVPRPPLARTRERLASDVKQLERHIQ